MKNLKKAYLRVSVQTNEQFSCAVELPEVDLIYLDAGLFPPEDWKKLADICHKGTGGFGKLICLKLPQIWRKKTEQFFLRHMEEFLHSGFDAFLASNPEEILWLKEQGVQDTFIGTDATLYSFNSLTDTAVCELTDCHPEWSTWSTELNFKELVSMKKKCSGPGRELIVYGRTALMVTAQCLRKTSIGCDRRISLMWMKDRTGAMMPVKNCCTFCTNTIYNAVPTVLFDLKEELESLNPDSIRYEFTCEPKEQVRQIMNHICPDSFTRGHFKRGVL